MGREIDLSGIHFSQNEIAKLEATGQVALKAVQAFVDAAKPFGKPLNTISESEESAKPDDTVRLHQSVASAEAGYDQAFSVADGIGKLLYRQFGI